MKTFYIASSSDPENVKEVRQLASTLEREFEMKWEFDWTISVSTEENPAKTMNPAGAVEDIRAAIDADLFIFLVTERISRGAHIELGARLAVGKEAHVVLRGNEPYFFYFHPLAQLWDSPPAFLDGFYFGDLPA